MVGKSLDRQGKANAGKAVRTRYWCAVLITTTAAAAIFWKGRAVYRHLLGHEHPASPADLAVIMTAILILQAIYWSVLIRPIPFEIKKNMLLANIMLFLSRISFMLAGALFSVVVFVRFDDLSFRLPGLIHFVAVLFTIFCFTRWIESWGRAFESGNTPDPFDALHLRKKRTKPATHVR